MSGWQLRNRGEAGGAKVKELGAAGKVDAEAEQRLFLSTHSFMASIDGDSEAEYDFLGFSFCSDSFPS